MDRTSGVCDHYAQDDAHAIHLARNIVANLNWRETSNVSMHCLSRLCLLIYTPAYGSSGRTPLQCIGTRGDHSSR